MPTGGPRRAPDTWASTTAATGPPHLSRPCDLIDAGEPVRHGASGPVLSIGRPTVPGMRLLHTSDWHIGRSLHGTDLLAEQEQVLGGLADVVSAESVDVVLVAGDVYDRAVPSADATGVLDRVLSRLRRAGAAVVLTPGNHDSARSLGFGAGLMARSGVHVRAVTPALAEPVMFTDEHGEVAVYGLPYLEPEVARHELGLTEGRSHEAVLAAAM